MLVKAEPRSDFFFCTLSVHMVDDTVYHLSLVLT